MEREEAKRIFKKLAASYPSWKVDSGIAESWVEDLEPEDAENAWANVNEYKRENKYPPALADIIKPNARLEAEREKERTRAFLLEQEANRAAAVEPPWKRLDMDRETWMRKVIEEGKERA